MLSDDASECSGYIFKSNLQSLTAMSTMEAELVASAFAMKGAVFCSNMLT